jgi:OmcA/MtrC family decaheme c-type cytochrome
LRDRITITKPFKEGNVKRPLILLLILSLCVPVLFLGCSGDDGSNGVNGISTLSLVSTEPAGTNCDNGGQKIQTGPDTNGNGILDSGEVTNTSYVCNGTATTTNESCVVCHGPGAIADVAVFMPQSTAVDLTVSNLTVTDNNGFAEISFNLKRGTVNFTTLAATSARVYVADLVPANTGGNTHSSPYFQRWAQERSTADTTPPIDYFQWTSFTNNGGGNYTIVMSTPLDNAVNQADVQRLFLRISGDTTTNTNNTAGILDFHIPALGATATAADLPQYQKAYVTVQTCRKCHGNPVQAMGHGSSNGYVDTRACVVCHSPLLPPEVLEPDEADLPAVINASRFFHQIHAAIDVPEFPTRIGGRGYGAVTFPQNVGWGSSTEKEHMPDCLACHNDGGNDLTSTAELIDKWKDHPTIEVCTSCHDVTFGAGATHSGGTQVDANCLVCHQAGGIGKGVAAAHAFVPAAKDVPEFDVAISMTPPSNGTHYVAGEAPLVTVTLKNHADNTDVSSSVYTSARGAVGVSGGGLRTANLYVYGPRAKSVPVLATNTITADPSFNGIDKLPTQGHSLFVGGTDPLVMSDAAGFKYQLLTIPAGMKAGTYMVHFEGADYGGVSEPDDYRTSSSATITFKIGQATDSLKVAGDGCLDCHAANRMHLTGTHAHNVPFNTDDCLACHDQSSNHGDPIANRVHAIHSANSDGDIYNFDNPGARDWSGVTYPQNSLNPSTGTAARCTTCHTSGNKTFQTNPFEMPCAGCHVMAGNGVIDHMLQNGGPYAPVTP